MARFWWGSRDCATAAPPATSCGPLPSRTCSSRLKAGPAAGPVPIVRTSLRRIHPLATATKTKLVPAAKSTAPRVAIASTKKLRPLGDRVVVRPIPGEEMTKSGIVIPDTAKEKPQEGMIIAVGPGRILDDGKREHMDLGKGDKVLYAKYAGTEF